MKKLIILIGTPGSGKSTWIKEHNLELYTVCPDELRILFSSVEKQTDGEYRISQKHDRIVWDTFYTILTYRLSIGVTTVIDATSSRTKDLNDYKRFADAHGYEMIIIDFTEVPLETCLAQNKMRPAYKYVPEDVIRAIYARYATQQIPNGVKLVDKNDEESIAELLKQEEIYNNK